MGSSEFLRKRVAQLDRFSFQSLGKRFSPSNCCAASPSNQATEICSTATCSLATNGCILAVHVAHFEVICYVTMCKHFCCIYLVSQLCIFDTSMGSSLHVAEHVLHLRSLQQFSDEDEAVISTSTTSGGGAAAVVAAPPPSVGLHGAIAWTTRRHRHVRPVAGLNWFDWSTISRQTMRDSTERRRSVNLPFDPDVGCTS